MFPLNTICSNAYHQAMKDRSEYLTIEHLLEAMLHEKEVRENYETIYSCTLTDVLVELRKHITLYCLNQVPDQTKPKETHMLQRVLLGVMQRNRQ